MTGQARRATVIAVLAGATVGTTAACRKTPEQRRPNSPARLQRGGDVVATVRSDPQSLSWYTGHDATTQLVTLLTQAKLVRVNRATEEVEPWLAENWTQSADGVTYTLKLRRNVTFADGHPFTSADVVFSFAAAYDKESALADSLQINGKRLVAAAIDPATVVITFPGAFGPGLRLLDNLPILPRHKLQAALDAGRFGSSWSLSTPVDQLTGLGPFVLTEYAAGQRLVFRRNDRYFRNDAKAPLPYVDRIVVEIVPEQDAQVLALQAGRSDMQAFEIRPEDYAPLKRAAENGTIQLLDLGPAVEADGFWINLKPGAFAHDPRAAWIQRDELRQAISLAVDRQAFADAVYLGAATPVFGPVTPGNKKWYSEAVPHASHDPAAAKKLLKQIGLDDRNGDGLLEDQQGTLARLTLLTQKGQTALERGAFLIREQLKTLGLAIDVVPLEGNALVHRFLSGRDYDAVYFHVFTTDTDPALTPDFWLSSGSARVWDLGQKTPATPWEAEIDHLMAQQATTLDQAERRRLFVDVQKIFVEHAPMLYFAAPRIYVAASTRLTNLTPAVSRPQLLWSADTIAVRQ